MRSRSYALALVRREALVHRAPGSAGLLELARQEIGIERLGAPHPDHIDGQVARDREQPGRYPPPTWVEGAGVFPGPYKGFLGNVLGHPFIAHDRQHQSIDPCLETPDERRRGVGVTGRQTEEQSLIWQSWRHHTPYYALEPAEGLPVARNPISALEA
jgi:hypothetical protein